MVKEVISTEKAPSAVGAYSQAIAANGLLFCSGQVALHPASGEFVGGTVGEQARVCMNNLTAVLEAAGSSLDKVVKVTIFLTDIDDFADVNETYATFFDADPPARATVAVAGLPKGANVEIECVALL
ncbi:MAG TPA: RidA family protein [Actinomycetota bacterium]|nr:RidA family protein [Actinomycetota bacterium]